MSELIYLFWLVLALSLSVSVMVALIVSMPVLFERYIGWLQWRHRRLP